MPYAEWRPGNVPPSPVYFDTSFLVASFVTKEPRYQNATALLGALLANETEMLLSTLTVSESLWTLAKMSFYQLQGKKVTSRDHFGPDVYRRHRAAIFEKYGSRMNQVHDWLRDWRVAGINIGLLPLNVDGLRQVSQVAPMYMERFQLGSADAVHLSTAEVGAKSLITTDTEFEKAQASSIEIVLIK